MKMLRAIIRTEKADEVAEALLEAGFPSMTRMDVYDRVKQTVSQNDKVFYDELPKHMILIVVQDEDEEKVAKIIMDTARTSDSHYGDGEIFVTDVSKAYTVSSKNMGL